MHYLAQRASAHFLNCRDRLTDPAAVAFYRRLRERGFKSDDHIDVLPAQRLIYVCVPKCASTTIKSALALLQGRPVGSDAIHKRRLSGLRSPGRVGYTRFHRLATSPDTLRFSFVRNPYARLVSCWADKLRGRPLVRGDSFVDLYLDHRAAVDASLPHGADATLSFPEFITFATATATARIDGHWNLQDDCIDMPGLPLDFVGRVESFHADFERVLDHVGADEEVRRRLGPRGNESRHEPWADYYTPELAARVFHAYERDFDRFAYPRALDAERG